MPALPLSTRNSGQALLLVLLSMAVVLTIVLSILSRSVTDVAVTSREEEALRAFSAAEAGVEKALIIGSDIGLTTIGDATFTAEVSGQASGGQEFANPIGLISGESLVFWFVAHDDNGNLICDATHPCFTGNRFKICWGKEGTAAGSATTPAIEVSVFYLATPGTYASARLARDTADPNSVRRGSNNFSAPDGGTCTTDGQTFEFQKTVDLTALGVPAASYSSQNGLQFVKVKTFYNTDVTHEMGIYSNFPGNSLLPSQGLRIESTGVSGESNRKIEVFQGFGEPPPIFDGAVFSLGGITK
jgi:type II secretory pathway pseudopilin PulG